MKGWRSIFIKAYSIDNIIVKELAEEYKIESKEAQKYINDTLKYNETNSMTCKNCNIINCEEPCEKWYINYKSVVFLGTRDNIHTF